jgi:hypothetical protein
MMMATAVMAGTASAASAQEAVHRRAGGGGGGERATAGEGEARRQRRVIIPLPVVEFFSGGVTARRKPTPISRKFSISRREIDRPHKNAIEKFQKVLCENVAISPPISHLTAAKRPVTPRESSVDDCDGLSMTAERYSMRPSQHG